ncbi:MAG: glycosyltransferase family 4 protein [Nitrospirae bacterium]|nr:glycosyltransferase family 4 protein [Nitrospirota bacterium]
MLNIQIIQPLVPEYRVPFFEALARDGRYDIQVFASATLPGTQSLRSAHIHHSFIHLNHPCKAFFGDRALWQKGLILESRLTAGDVLVVCGNPRFLSNYPLLWNAKRRGVATVWWGIGTMPGQSSLNGVLRRQIMKWADVVLLYTDRERDEFLNIGFPGKRLFAINNAIDQEPIQGAIKQWTTERLREFQWQENLLDKRVFLFCGRVTPKARVDLAIQALSLLLRENTKTLLIIIGDGEERFHLQELARQLGVTESIRWLGTLYDQSVIAPWFLTAKAFVYPGYIGLSNMHAMGYGLPVITHRNMSNQSPEVAALHEGMNGLLFEEGNAEHLARMMHRLGSCEEVRLSMSRQASQTVAVEFTLHEMVRRFLSALEAASEKVKSGGA